MRLKRKAFNECILPVMTYGCETWSLSNTQLEKLVTTQRKMERIMVGFALKDRKSTNWIRQQSGVDRHYHEHTRKQTQMGGNTWQGEVTTDGQSVTEWIPRKHKRPRGRPRMR